MAAKRKSLGKKSARKIQTKSKRAGKPVKASAARAARAAAAPSRPTDEELDLRNRLKSGPRRLAGPPLTGDTPRRAAMRALRDEVLPDPTDPE